MEEVNLLETYIFKGTHMTNYTAEDFFGKRKEPMINEFKTVEYWSESKEQWLPLHDMHHDWLLNLVIKLVSKNYDGKFRVTTQTTQVEEVQDEYLLTSLMQ